MLTLKLVLFVEIYGDGAAIFFSAVAVNDVRVQNCNREICDDFSIAISSHRYHILNSCCTSPLPPSPIGAAAGA